jgi:hypothetical protein
MDSKEFCNYVKQMEKQHLSSNQKDIRIWYSIIEKKTENRIMPYRYGGLHFGFQERNGEHTVTLIKDYKITYNSKTAGNQLYFFSNMVSKLDKRIRQLIASGELQIKRN